MRPDLPTGPTRRTFIAGAAAMTAAANLAPASAASGGSTDLAYRTAGDLMKALADRQVSARELVELPRYRASRRSTRRSTRSSCAISTGRAPPRCGRRGAGQAANAGRCSVLPMTVKEQYAVAGLPTTWGDPKNKDWKAEVDALAVQRLKAAGAVILGKTNVPLNLIGLAELQRGLRHHQQSVGPVAHPRRLVGRLGRGACGRLRRRWSSAPTSAARCARRRIFAGCSPISRPLTWCRSAAPARRGSRPFRCAATSPFSGRWRAAPPISRSNWRFWPARTSCRGHRLQARPAAAAARQACRFPRAGDRHASALPDRCQHQVPR